MGQVTPEESLTTLAEMSIAVAGFTGLIVTLRPTQSRKWSEQELIRIRGILALCLLVFLSSMLPYGLSGLTLDSRVVFGVPLAVYGGATTSIALLVTLRRGMVEVVAPRITRPIAAVFSAIGIAALLSGLGVIVPFSSGILVLALTWGLVMASVTLIATVAIVTRAAQRLEDRMPAAQQGVETDVE
jgi:hypothetical protein